MSLGEKIEESPNMVFWNPGYLQPFTSILFLPRIRSMIPKLKRLIERKLLNLENDAELKFPKVSFGTFGRDGINESNI